MWKRFQIGADIHGDEQDKAANSAFFKFRDVWKPQIRGCGGDLYNYVPLRAGASDDEKHLSMDNDIAAGTRWLEEFKPTDFLEGNHDRRLRILAEANKGPISDLARRGQNEFMDRLRKMGCSWKPYHKRKGILRIGNLKVVHGYGGSAVGAARKHAQVYGSVILFHFHSIQLASIEGIDNRIGRVGGCLCHLDMDYNDAHLGSLMHRHGWVYGVVNTRTGKYHVWQAEKVGGIWMLPNDIVEIR